MLPILRIIPVGGVLLAIMILVLALSPPGGSRQGLAPTVVSARGALMQQDEHPEWRQFLILAATKRANELSRLRELPDMPVRSARDANRFAGLPVERGDTDPDDDTGTIADVPAMTMPVEIGETSSTELPVSARDEKSPAISTPERAKAPKESKTKTVRRTRHVRARPKPEPPAPFNLFEAIFGPLQTNQLANRQVSQPAAASSTYPQ